MIEHYSFQFEPFSFASKSILISSYMADNASKREFRRAEVGGAEMFLLESILALLVQFHLTHVDENFYETYRESYHHHDV